MAKTKVAIIENSPFLGRYFSRFLDAEGVDHQTFKVWRKGASFPDGGFDSCILTGDLHNVTDGLRGYHRRELEFLDSIRGGKVFASCFAHQLIAWYRGGEVARRTQRLLNRERVRVTGEHPALEGITGFTAVCMNIDEVIEPPEGARVIAESDNCRYQMLAYHDDVLTCQAHPELDAVRNPFAMDALALLLSRGPTRGFRDFRRSRRKVGSDGDEFMRRVIGWLAGG